MYIIDRFEENWAVIETSEKLTFNLPKELLPCDAHEGDALIISTVVDQEATAERRKNANKLLENFFDE